MIVASTEGWLFGMLVVGIFAGITWFVLDTIFGSEDDD